MSVSVTPRPGPHGVTVTIDRPDVRNAMSPEIIAALEEAVVDAADEDDVRAVVVTGTGSAFSAGADIDEFASLADDPDAVLSYLRQFAALFETIESVPVPVVAAVNGPAHGGGYELALACDIRVASRSAEFCPAEIAMGIVPPFERLAANLSDGRVRELCYTGGRLDADSAARAGLVSDVVPQADLDERVGDLVAAIARRSPNAVARTKQAIVHHRRRTRGDTDRFRLALDETCVRHPDFEESVRAFRENREPDYG